MNWAKLGGIIAGIFIVVMAIPVFLFFAVAGILVLAVYLLFGERVINALAKPC